MERKIKTLEVITGDNEKEEVFHLGIVVRSPNGKLWQIKVSNEGTISTEEILE